VHQFSRTQNGIYRASLNTFGTADTFGFSDKGQFARPVFSMADIQWNRWNTQQSGQIDYRLRATWRASVNCLASGNCLCVRTATGVAALTALCLRKQQINAFFKCNGACP